MTHGITFEIKNISFCVREEVISITCREELRARHLPENQWRYLIGKRFNADIVIGAHNAAGTDQFKEGDVDSLTSNMLRGITHLVVTFDDSLKDNMFVEKVGRSSPREIGRIAKERKAGSMGYAEAMLGLYNKKGSSNGTLKWAKLYENKLGV